jgi:hypothetical protein
VYKYREGGVKRYWNKWGTLAEDPYRDILKNLTYLKRSDLLKCIYYDITQSKNKGHLI